MNCPRCGAPSHAGARFCAQCGHAFSDPESGPLASALSPALTQVSVTLVGGERRLVTVLFADVTGSTQMAQSMDPEDYAGIMQGALDRLIEPVQTFGGTLAQTMGDGVLALFGAPTAHDDDAERAVRAALAMQSSAQCYARQLQEHGLDFAIRVGINTGLVVAGQVEIGEYAEHRAIGDAVNLAQRVESAAQPGSVLITTSTHRLVQERFLCRSQGPFLARGRSQPTEVFEVLGLQPHPPPGWTHARYRSPLVGRAAELTQLHDGLGQLATGRGVVICLVGEAGIGKSRLLAEFRSQIESNPPGDTQDPPSLEPGWLDGRCLSFQQSIPYGPIQEMLLRWAGIRGEEAPARIQQRLQARLGYLGGAEAIESTPYLLTLLGIPLPAELQERLRHLNPEQVQRRVHMALVGLVEYWTRERPLVISVEDLQWADDLSLAALDRLIPVVMQRPVLLLVLHRPGLDDAHQRPWHTAMELAPDRCRILHLRALTAEHSSELVGNLRGNTILPAGLVDAIVARGEGNPLFLEEIVRSVTGDGDLRRAGNGHEGTADQIAVPDTLFGALTARLDRLQEAPRQLVQTAAVLGRTFSYQLLGQVWQQAGGSEHYPDCTDQLARDLAYLRDMQLVERQDEDTWLFQHALIQEVAYRSLLRARRRQLHGLCAQCLEEGGSSTRLGQSRALAHHYALSDWPQKALPHLLQAGLESRQAYANQEAKRFLAQAVAITGDQVKPQVATSWQSLAEVHEILGEYSAAETCYARARDLWDELGHPAEAAEACYHLGQIVGRQNRGAESLVHCQEGLRRARAAPEGGRQIAWGYQILAGLLLRNHPDHPEGLRYLDQATSLSAAQEDYLGLARSLGIRALACAQHGRLSQATDLALQTIDAALQAERPQWVATWHNNAAYWLLLQGRPHEAASHIRQGLELAQQTGDVIAEGHLYTSLADLERYWGHSQDAHAAASQAASLAQMGGRRDLEAQAAASEGLVAAQQGDLQRAVARLERALDLAQRFAPSLVTTYHHYLAETYLDCKDLVAAEHHTQQGLARAWAEQAPREMGMLLRDQARLAAATGSWTSALALFEESHQRLSSMGDILESARTTCHWGIACLSQTGAEDRRQGNAMMRNAMAQFHQMDAQADRACSLALLQEMAAEPEEEGYRRLPERKGANRPAVT